MSSTNDAIGGADTITLGTGDAIVIGGAGGDSITGDVGGGNNVILGDGGTITAADQNDHRYGNLPITLGSIATTDDGIGGNDTISTGNGNDVVLGGTGADTIHIGSGTNLVLGDDGAIVWASDGNPADIDLVTSTDPTDGGNDTITIGTGEAIVVGGAGADTITGGAGDERHPRRQRRHHLCELRQPAVRRLPITLGMRRDDSTASAAATT